MDERPLFLIPLFPLYLTVIKKEYGVMHFVGPTVKNAVLFQQAGSMAQGWIPAQMPTFSSVSSASAPCSLPTISPFPLI